MTKKEIKQELIEDLIIECNEQIKIREHKRDFDYREDLDQYEAFNNQIRYYKFMISRLESFEKRQEDFIKSLISK